MISWIITNVLSCNFELQHAVKLLEYHFYNEQQRTHICKAFRRAIFMRFNFVIIFFFKILVKKMIIKWRKCVSKIKYINQSFKHKKCFLFNLNYTFQMSLLLSIRVFTMNFISFQQLLYIWSVSILMVQIMYDNKLRLWLLSFYSII